MRLARFVRRGTAFATAGLALTVMNSSSALAERRVLPPGTVIPVRLDQPLNSKDSRPGDRFTATVRYGRDDAGLPDGTRIEGVVREAIPHSNGKPGILDVDFRRVLFPNGESRALDASLISLDSKNIQRGRDGRLEAKGGNDNNERLKWVGIGAGAGLLLSTLTRGNTLTSVLIGAGAGYLYNELNRKNNPRDVDLKAGTEFGIRLDRQLAFDDTWRGRYSRNDYDAGADYATYADRDRFHRAEIDDPPLPDERDRYLPEGIGVLVDHRDVRFNGAKPFQRNGTVMVPFAAVAREAGVPFTFDSRTGIIRADNGRIRLATGSRVAIVNGERRRLEAAAEVRDGVLFVPMEFLAIALDGSASWDAPSRTVVITTRERIR